MNNYAAVIKKIAPKKKKLAEMTIILEKANSSLMAKQDELDKVKSNVAKIKKDCEVMIERQNELEKIMELTKARLERAESLTTLLADEGTRWELTVDKLQFELNHIVGDVFLASASASYHGPFTSVYRLIHLIISSLI